MNRYVVLAHICSSLLFVLGIMKLRQHFDLPIPNWTLVLTVVFFWLGVFNARRGRAK